MDKEVKKEDRKVSDNSSPKGSSTNHLIEVPSISLPKGGGAIRGMGEKFSANPVTGTGSMSIPLPISKGRGFTPQLSLSYDSGAGNGPFGWGWSLSLPTISRKTDKGLPRYFDDDESDVYLLSGAEDLVPILDINGNRFQETVTDTGNNQKYTVYRYRPRIEGLFARIERWKNNNTGDVHWRSITKDNITTMYGLDDKSRIYAASHIPNKPPRIFSWLICESFDDKGNCVQYGYKAENAIGVPAQCNEANRDVTKLGTNLYLKHVFYGNTLSRGNSIAPINLNNWRRNNTWLFELVFDYGEHDLLNPLPNNNGNWLCRNDPFSTYRAGFEVRTYRLCQRVLMFHHFINETNFGNNYLVKSMNFNYRSNRGITSDVQLGNPVASFIDSISQISYCKNGMGYLKRSLPPLQFIYSEAHVSNVVNTITDDESLKNLPNGIDSTRYQWLDLFGEGVSGIFTEQAGQLFYKRNLSPVTFASPDANKRVQFGPLETVGSRPNTSMGQGKAQLMDLAGDGRPDIVMLDNPTPGFYEVDEAEKFLPFKAFLSRLNLAATDPNLKFIDLNGDGFADAVVTENEVITWFPSLAEEGFDAAIKIAKANDEEQGPAILFADGNQSIYLADMSGDGLTDIVRIRNGEICYWPNLGYGNFGAKITMANSPWFDVADGFEQRRIRVTDIDGSGNSDLIYLARDGVYLYFNQSGNSFSAAKKLAGFPSIDNVATINTVDLFGNGTACLVWSSPLPNDSGQQLRYVDLMGGQKPHLLIKTINNLGAETNIEYVSSTKFYLQDKLNGTPWITKLPFPVYCVAKVSIKDQWRKTNFSTTYSYHHGYFDGVEREFRGFGRVEQIDVESYDVFANGNINSPYITPDKTLYQPPIKTVTWFHTGVYINRETILSQYKNEYFPNGFNVNTYKENALPEPDFAQQNLTSEEWREALRACKGMMLRQEIYELDVDALANGKHLPVKIYSAAYHNCHIKLLQAQGINRYAVFIVTESEALTYNYELDLTTASLAPDPRINHTLNLTTDEYGNIQQAITVAYPRVQNFVDNSFVAAQSAMIQKVQKELHIAYSETRYTKDVIDTANDINLFNYRLRVPYEVQTYELIGLTPKNTSYFTLNELRQYDFSPLQYPVISKTPPTKVSTLAYHQLTPATTPAMRLVEKMRTLFFNDDLSGFLVLSKMGKLGLIYENYKLALTDELLNAILTPSKLDNTMMPKGGTVRATLRNEQNSGYVSGVRVEQVFGEKNSSEYWMRGGIAGFAADAAEHFYLPESYQDAFGNVTTLSFDPYDLFLQSSTDALDNQVKITDFDFRVLAPLEMQDANDNFTNVVFDVLGLPIATAIRGKGAEADNLTAYTKQFCNPDLSSIINFFTQQYDVAIAQQFLADATSRFIYYMGEKIDENNNVTWNNHPASACTIVREQHVAQLAVNQHSPLQTSFEYSDGMGAVLVKKIQAEPDPAILLPTPNDLRWIASGKTILNNKGKPVKQYEPYFSDPNNNFFEEPQEVGVTPIIYYDAAGRVIRTEMPDGSLSYVKFSSWHVATYDQNDSLSLTNSWYINNANNTATTEQKRAAALALAHADTPAVTFLDSLGRNVISVAHNRKPSLADPTQLVEEKYLTFTKLDAEGKTLWIRGAMGHFVMQYFVPVAADNRTEPTNFVPCYDIAGNLLFQFSAEAGSRWTINDAAGKPFLSWDLNQSLDQNGVATNENRTFALYYDALHRPTEQWLTINNNSPHMIERFIYVDTKSNFQNAQALNLCGQLYQHYDQSGLIENKRVDFKGSILEVHRQLISAYKATSIDWKTNLSQLENEIFIQITEYDALKRMTRLYNWHKANSRVAVYEPNYNKRGLLHSELLTVRATKIPTGYTSGSASQQSAVIMRIDYDAKGQRQHVYYGNNTVTNYNYDPQTFRLIKMERANCSWKSVVVPEVTPPNNITTVPTQGTLIQDFYYYYDPVGNVTEIRDAAAQPFFFNNQQVNPQNQYTYDPLYRLISATGRENRVSSGAFSPTGGTALPVIFPVSNPNALRNYTQNYLYNAVGNIMQMQHVAVNGSWTRAYSYAANSNRLLQTGTGGADLVKYHYDSHGNMLNIAEVNAAFFHHWDYRDMLQSYNSGGGGITYYNYDAGKQRTRKVNENINNVKMWERIYLGGLELYRKYMNGVLVEEIESIHVIDGQHRLLLIDDIIQTNNVNFTTGPHYRYQYGNHLDSSTLEMDEQAQIISFEEYHPFGTSSYQATRSGVQINPKRYRYTGKERDEESGFYYHGARYYACWLGRWISPDPAGLVDGVNVYQYVKNNPVIMKDPDGRQATYPELNAVFRVLANARTSITPEEFHKLIGANEKNLLTLLSPFGFKGCPATPEATLKAFDNAYNNWAKVRQSVGAQPAVRAPVPKSEAQLHKEAEQQMWAVAASNPIAAVSIGIGAALSYGFELTGIPLRQDPRRAAIGGVAISHLVTAGGSMNAPVAPIEVQGNKPTPPSPPRTIFSPKTPPSSGGRIGGRSQPIDPAKQSLVVGSKDATQVNEVQTMVATNTFTKGKPQVLAFGYTPGESVTLGWSGGPKDSPKYEFHPAVTEALSTVPYPSPYHGKCAEPHLISQTLWAGRETSNLSMDVVRVKTNTPENTCSTCTHLREHFEINMNVTRSGTLGPTFGNYSF